MAFNGDISNPLNVASNYCVMCDCTHSIYVNCAAGQQTAVKSSWRWLFEQANKNEQEYLHKPLAEAAQARKIRIPFIGIDPAKPGSDQTVVGQYTGYGGGVREVLFKGSFDPYKAMAEVVERQCAEAVVAAAKAFPSAAPSAPAASLPSFDVDHAWDMVVLAARTSRYEG
jgi:hypothetical protein